MNDEQRLLVYPRGGSLPPIEVMLASMWLEHVGVSAGDLTQDERLKLAQDIRTAIRHANPGTFGG